MTKNLNYLYHVQYYKCLEGGSENINSVDKANEALEKYKMVRKDEWFDFSTHRFSLSTLYPGLLIGLGYAHGTGNAEFMEKIIKEEVAKLGLSFKSEMREKIENFKDKVIEPGFSFDYVTGEPYIPSSSVKGVLRSAFKQKAYIKEIANLSDIVDEQVIEKIEADIFGDENGIGRDIFFDGILDVSANKNKGIMGFDYITPHIPKGSEEEQKKYFGLSDPTPIRMVKVLPNVVFTFHFILKDTLLADGTKLTAQRKEKIFQQILLDFGIGAKTNVGYGAFEEYVPGQKERTSCKSIR